MIRRRTARADDDSTNIQLVSKAIAAYKGCKKEPYKTGFYLSCLGGLIYAYQTNPTQQFMLNDLREWRQIMSLVPLSIHNNQADEELVRRSVLLCQNRLHHYNLWFFSLLVRSTYDDSIRTYESQDPNLKEWIWKEFYNNIIDIGFFGKWYKLHQNLKDYDINKDEIAALPS
ncbi:unnamed protein product [Cylicocyclus nassatus]|uniref:Uncharacterized protein n=1 Tax=Cylicocyclus nassatus TaxID=53992 RepID=A0AA36HAT0_CYLNA|nr:unnamed protein product [Cylicocyclus nassatus]